MSKGEYIGAMKAARIEALKKAWYFFPDDLKKIYYLDTTAGKIKQKSAHEKA